MKVSKDPIKYNITLYQYKSGWEGDLSPGVTVVDVTVVASVAGEIDQSRPGTDPE